MYCNLEKCFIKGSQGINYETELDSVVKDLYKCDFNLQSLKTQFLILQSQLQKDAGQLSVEHIAKFLKPWHQTTPLYQK